MSAVRNLYRMCSHANSNIRPRPKLHTSCKVQCIDCRNISYRTRTDTTLKQLYKKKLRTQTSLRSVNPTIVTGPNNFSTVTSEDDWFSNQEGTMYKSHRPTSLLQKSVLTVGSACMALYDPYRHDMVAVLGETTGYLALKRLRKLMLDHPEGQQILRDRPRLNSTTMDMDAMVKLPDGTMGREYHRFMVKNKITADSRAEVQYVDDPELAYVMQRYRETHDFYHTLLGLPINLLGEVVVKWFEMINTRLPMCALGAAFGPLRLSTEKRKQLREHYLPTVIKMASRSDLLMNCYFEKRWSDPLDTIRREFKVDAIPRP